MSSNIRKISETPANSKIRFWLEGKLCEGTSYEHPNGSFKVLILSAFKHLFRNRSSVTLPSDTKVEILELGGFKFGEGP